MKYRILSLFGMVVIWTGTAFGMSSLGSLLPPKPLDGWVLAEGPRHYNRKTLFEHINGQAELYLKYGYQRSVFGMYQHVERTGEQIEVDVYDMGSVAQAFGVYSRMRIEGRSGGVGLGSSMDDRSLLFYKGRYFVILDGAAPNLPALKEVALRISTGIPDSSPAPREIVLFPQKNLKPDSIQYFPEGLLGHRFLKRGFQGTYFEVENTEVKAKAETEDKEQVEAQAKIESKTKAGVENREFHLFLAIFKNREESKSALTSYREYLANKGKVEFKIPANFGPRALAGEDPYKGRVLVVQKGVYLIGIAGFEGEKEARDCLAEAIKNVK